MNKIIKITAGATQSQRKAVRRRLLLMGKPSPLINEFRKLFSHRQRSPAYGKTSFHRKWVAVTGSLPPKYLTEYSFWMGISQSDLHASDR